MSAEAGQLEEVIYARKHCVIYHKVSWACSRPAEQITVLKINLFQCISLHVSGKARVPPPCLPSFPAAALYSQYGVRPWVTPPSLRPQPTLSASCP